MEKSRLRLVFMGTPDFAAHSLEVLSAHHEVVLVVTQPDRPKNRGKKFMAPPVKETAERLGLSVVQPEALKKEPELLAKVRSLAPDAIVVVAFGQLLPKEWLSVAPLGCINLHASLLPKYRGASPIQHAILCGDAVSGNTVMLMEEGLDTGPILLQESIPLQPEMTAGELHEVLMERGGPLLLDALDGLERGDLVPRAQEAEAASVVRKIKKEDALLNFQESSEALARKVRAFCPFPLAYAFSQDLRVRILRAHAVAWRGSEAPGTILSQTKDGILVRCGEGALAITLLQLPGKRPVSAEAFLNGNRLPEGRLNESY
ncbi:Methionyl-tRNA formyltransferase [Clostridiaceae bacterium JG1575]|nr:Methionyl-tRNA formyltransferase [Clostridiaceae bacterium JG1575]